MANFGTRLVVTLTFVLLFLLLPTSAAIPVCVVWGFALLSGLSWMLARVRSVSVFGEIWKHSAVAIAAIAVSKAIGDGIASLVGQG